MGAPSCQGCRERDARIAALEHRVAELEAKVRELLSRNASNSSLPPSANPPGAPAPVQKKKSKRRRGGQPGHPPHLRQLLPPERVSQTIPLLPDRCQRCQTPLPRTAGPDDPAPSRHQVVELPELTAVITEYQGHARTCPCCGHVTQAPIPARIRAHSCGPKLTAVMAYLAGRHHVSKRGVEEIVETVFDAPMSLGTIAALEQEVSQALAPAHAEAVAAVRQAPVKHVDETGWKQAGRRCWLWLAATPTVAAFTIHARRNLAGLTALLGETITGFVCTDRWGTYNILHVQQRQVCWAHLKRDFQKCVDRGGPALNIGRKGLAVVQQVFEQWHLFRGGGISRKTLYRRLEPVAVHLHHVLEAGCGCADGPAATFCANLLTLVPALWRFVVTEGVEPTNNHAERLLRRGVLWRKNAFGCQSDGGCRFVERILTVVQTLRLQQRSVLAYLHAALRAHRSALPAPELLPIR